MNKSLTTFATFAAGCFWGVEETFRQLNGVQNVTVGYTGGETEHPTYEEVCTSQTGHAEAVQVEFDPQEISYEQLLDVFWNNHNPTQFNRQGPDYGSQYRSAVFFHDENQRDLAERSKQSLQASGKFGDRRIVTEITPAVTFWAAEEYHQQYLAKRGLACCHI